MHTIVFLIRGSYININLIDRLLDDFYFSRLDEGYSFKDFEIKLIHQMKKDPKLFFNVVNGFIDTYRNVGYLIAVYSLPYIDKS